MAPERWTELLERSDSLRPIPPHRDREARDAVRVQLLMAANAEELPVGVVTDARYLVPKSVLSPHRNRTAGKRRAPYDFKRVKPKAPYAGKESDDGDEG
jgi:hypothetical protein